MEAVRGNGFPPAMAASSSESDPLLLRRRRSTQDNPEFPRDLEHKSELHRRGSLCDRHCAAVNNPHGELGDMHSGSHHYGHGFVTPRMLPVIPSQSCCPLHSEEVQTCDACLMKTTITAENEVEAHKLSNNYKFGFKKWKSHVTERPWEDRSEIVKELYSDLNIVRSPSGSMLTCGNVFYLLFFGWWLSLLYILLSLVMFLTVLGAPYGKLCWKLAGYFLWPFGKVIQKMKTCNHNCNVKFNKYDIIAEGNEGKEATPLLTRPEESANPDPDTHWHRPSTYVWLLTGYPFLSLIHALICLVSWLLVFYIPIAKMNVRIITKVLLMPPEQVHIQSLRKTAVLLDAEVVLCCYRACNAYYYKYAVDGINVFAVNLLPLVIVTLVLGYGDKHNFYTSSVTKFTLALLSIMPLSYYIGMAIASISAQSNFAVGAVVNATFGSITELTFYITALIKGAREKNKCYEEIVKSALTGTLLGCVLFIPGLCMVIGGIRHQEQRFNSRSAGVSSALLFLSVGGVFAPTLFSKVYGRLVCGECQNITHEPPGHYICQSCHFDLMENNGTLYYSHVEPLVYTVCLLLPVAYIIGLFFALKTHSHIYDIHISDCHLPGHHHSAVVHWSRWRAMLILLVATLCMSACADLATEHISPILNNSPVSQYFIGVTVLAMVPELPEIVNGIQFALQNNLSLSIEIGNSIAVQVCMLQIPIVVLFTVFYPTDFILVFSDLHVYASIFSVVLMNYIFMDGKCDYFQGTVLVMVYFILLAVYYFAPSPAGC
ncbi:LOW QUALITY PROTEIN: putative cation exchanger C521.04c [Sceloporus undulatus]|uniref:LOW QUALITY PROTEIN: putative cation exchanger C521.04c n=1 Tax=Sceloporus undulatus TaxID=8520 RepID=UPI001C4BCA4A|nr:LOW QUALITY PROTEIN: putative cation exchanger C521.04c [Sceloporus undulatus]